MHDYSISVRALLLLGLVPGIDTADPEIYRSIVPVAMQRTWHVLEENAYACSTRI